MKTDLNRIANEVTNSLLKSIHQQLQIPKLDIEEGEIRIIDRDDAACAIFLGLYDRDATTGESSVKPSIIWSIEVFADLQGA
ncbi:MAG: hypothetical protein SGI77_01350 [Pirellulaceae bacterium]|nr:hypothetical protein [Pirellulaceae bacterium]